MTRIPSSSSGDAWAVESSDQAVPRPMGLLESSGGSKHSADPPPSAAPPHSATTAVSGESPATPSASESAPAPPPQRPPRTVELRERLDHHTLRIGQLLGWLTLFAVLYTLYAARAILMPFAMALVLTLLLRQPVRWLRKRHIPEPAGALLCLGAALLIGSLAVANLMTPARQWLESAPVHLHAAGERLQSIRDSLQGFDLASRQMEEFATGNPADQPLEVEIRQSPLMSKFFLISSTGQAFASVAMVLVITFFLLSNVDVLIRNIIHSLPTRREKRNLVELVADVERGISSYLSTITLINGCLGIVIGLAMWALGVPNPALWGIMAALLNFVPYVGAVVGTLVMAIVGILTVDSLAYAALIPLTYYLLTAIEGNFITPNIVGRFMSLNPLFVLLSLVFWGWLWGVPGALLAVPLLAVVKITCDHFESTRSIGDLLSG